MRLGDGSKINVWNDPWLQAVDSSYVQSQPIEGFVDLRAFELIDANSNSWRVDVVEHIFNARDCQQIMSMPIHFNGDEDKLIWKLSRDGLYQLSLLTIIE